MAFDQREEDVLRERQAAMGHALGELHFLLWKDLAWLWVKWKEFKTLFATRKTDVDLLNAVAPTFFGHVQQVLWSDILLHLCRLTDPSTSAGRSNLSVARLPSAISDPQLKSAVQRLSGDARAKAQFARDWRNRELAHRDLQRALAPNLHQLARADGQLVEQTLEGISAVLNKTQAELQGSSVAYEHSIEPLGGSGVLLRRLQSYTRTRLVRKTRSDT